MNYTALPAGGAAFRFWEPTPVGGKYIDTTGQRFGAWTVLAFHPKQYRSRFGRAAHWICRCTCGVERVVIGSNLRNGRSRGCGCHQRRRTIDLVGRRFGEWLVIAMCPGRRRGLIYWHCRCSCGEERDVRGDGLRDGISSNCGCIRIEKLRKRATTHGMTGTRIYRCWQDMLARCLNPNHRSFSHYGGRGITVCKRWQHEHGFENFHCHMGNPSRPDLSLDRINNDGNYEPGNVRWATRAEQRANQRPAKRKRQRAKLAEIRAYAAALARAASGGVRHAP